MHTGVHYSWRCKQTHRQTERDRKVSQGHVTDFFWIYCICAGELALKSLCRPWLLWRKSLRLVSWKSQVSCVHAKLRQGKTLKEMQCASWGSRHRHSISGLKTGLNLILHIKVRLQVLEGSYRPPGPHKSTGRETTGKKSNKILDCDTWQHRYRYSQNKLLLHFLS